MLPDFDENGNLPPGVYPATLQPVVARFGSPSLRRKTLTVNLKDFIEFLSAFALDIWLDGSYVTARLSPNDVDLVATIRNDFNWQSPEGRRLLGYLLKSKALRLHIFVYKAGVEQAKIDRLLDWFSRDRDELVKGIIHVRTTP